jgi:hypothetical protein
MNRAEVRGKCYLLLQRRIMAGGADIKQPDGYTFPIARIVNSLDLPGDTPVERAACHRKLDRMLEAEWNQVEPAQAIEISDADIQPEPTPEPARRSEPERPVSSKNRCDQCNAPLVFLKTSKGKSMPVDYSGQAMDDKRDGVMYDPLRHKSHFATCPARRKSTNENEGNQ